MGSLSKTLLIKVTERGEGGEMRDITDFWQVGLQTFIPDAGTLPLTGTFYEFL